MALFKKNKEQLPETELIINTDNTWFTQGLPQYIIRQGIAERDKSHKTLERMGNKAQGYINPVIVVENFSRIVENDQTIELINRRGMLYIVPKYQILEIRY